MPPKVLVSRDLQPVFALRHNRKRQLRLFVRLPRSMRCPLGSPPQGTLIEIPSLVILDSESFTRPAKFPENRFDPSSANCHVLSNVIVCLRTTSPGCPRPTSTGRERKKKERQKKKKERKQERKKKKRKKYGSPDRLVMNLWDSRKTKEVSRTNLLEEESAILEKAASGVLGGDVTSRLSKPD